jgi:hypothetical protein
MKEIDPSFRRGRPNTGLSFPRRREPILLMKLIIKMGSRLRGNDRPVLGLPRRKKRSPRNDGPICDLQQRLSTSHPILWRI